METTDKQQQKDKYLLVANRVFRMFECTTRPTLNQCADMHTNKVFRNGCKQDWLDSCNGKLSKGSRIRLISVINLQGMFLAFTFLQMFTIFALVTPEFCGSDFTTTVLINLECLCGKGLSSHCCSRLSPVAASCACEELGLCYHHLANCRLFLEIVLRYYLHTLIGTLCTSPEKSP